MTERKTYTLTGKYHRKMIEAPTHEEFKSKIFADPVEFHKGRAICHKTRTIYKWVQV